MILYYAYYYIYYARLPSAKSKPFVRHGSLAKSYIKLLEQLVTQSFGSLVQRCVGIYHMHTCMICHKAIEGITEMDIVFIISIFLFLIYIIYITYYYYNIILYYIIILYYYNILYYIYYVYYLLYILLFHSIYILYIYIYIL